MNAAIYARFSTDKQSGASIADQVRICRVRAEGLGLDVAAVHADRAVSGASTVQSRPAGRALLADALAGRFSVLMIEGLDRLSRDQVEQETIVRRLEHRGIRIIGVADGYDTAASGDSGKLLRGVRGLINETYLDDLRKKTHRGLAGQIERGYHAGGLSFGFRSVVAGVNARGEPIGHHLEVDETQAGTVREVFTRYAAGESCQRIAASLNERRVPGPRGGTWCVSALYGSPAKGSGVLNNALYIGRYIWNRSQWVKDPDTRQRQRRERPREDWQIVERPELRILDDELWHAVRERMDAPRRAGGRRGRGGVATTLFGGLLRCGICGGAVVAMSARHYGCAARKDRGRAVCAGVLAPRQEVDRVLLD
ncbi:MAG: recombinase family protein, partial [Casimicrobiaceae bacterium]